MKKINLLKLIGTRKRKVLVTVLFSVYFQASKIAMQKRQINQQSIHAAAKLHTPVVGDCYRWLSLETLHSNQNYVNY